MGYGKWIGGILGFMAQGPLGALAGFAIGSLFDTAAGSVEQGGERTAGGNMNDYEDAGYGGRRNSFLFSMLVMASYIIINKVYAPACLIVVKSLQIAFA